MNDDFHTVSTTHHSHGLDHSDTETVSAISLVLGEFQDDASGELIKEFLIKHFDATVLVGEPNSPEFIEQLKELYNPRDWTLHVREAVLSFCGKYGVHPPAAVFLNSAERKKEWDETLKRTSRRHPQRTAQLMLQPSFARIMALHRQGNTDREIANFLDCRIDAVTYAVNALIRDGYLPGRSSNPRQTGRA